MIWWAHIRALPLACVVTAVACAAAALTTGLPDLPFPDMLGGISLPVPLTFVIPLIPTWTLLYGLSRVDVARERAAVRPISLFDRLTWVVLVAAVTIGAFAVHSSGAWPLAWAYPRDLAGYLGLAGLASRIIGSRYAALVPTLFVFVAATTGAPQGRIQHWAWPLTPPDDLLAATMSVVLFVAGLTALSTRRRN